MQKPLALVAAALLASSCCAAPRGQATIPIPPRTALPTLTPEQDAAIPDPVYEILDEREETLQAYIDRLIGLIKAHNSEDDK